MAQRRKDSVRNKADFLPTPNTFFTVLRVTDVSNSNPVEQSIPGSDTLYDGIDYYSKDNNKITFDG